MLLCSSRIRLVLATVHRREMYKGANLMRLYDDAVLSHHVNHMTLVACTRVRANFPSLTAGENQPTDIKIQLQLLKS